MILELDAFKTHERIVIRIKFDSLAEMYRRLNFLVLSILLGLLARRTFSLKDAAMSEANEFRHVPTMGSISKNTTYSVRCSIPTKVFQNEISLFHLLPSDELGIQSYRIRNW